MLPNFSVKLGNEKEMPGISESDLLQIITLIFCLFSLNVLEKLFTVQ